MGQTHTGDVTKHARRIAAWLVDRAKSAGAPTTEAELNARVSTRCPKHFTDDEKNGVERAAMVLFRQKDPDGYERVIAAYAGYGSKE